MTRERVLILGAAGRDFHNFNVYYRDNERYEVVAFTATQIPDIAGRLYPAVLAGKLYPNGIPIYAEEDLESIVAQHHIDTVVFSYSDVNNDYLMARASRALAAGANFEVLGPKATMVKSTKPVIAVCAVRTGCGKSQTTRRVCKILQGMNKRVVAIRHPMPYGDLAKQAVQRFGSYEDMDKHQCTIEEREEYEPHIDSGIVVYAGVDYEKILRAAEQEADVIVWDGGNNDFSFYAPDLLITVTDPHRAGHELTYFPGSVNFRMASVIVINKMDSAKPEDVATIVANVKKFNPQATIVKADSPLTLEDPSMIKGKTVLVVEDGPTLTHGEMKFGAGTIAAQRFGAANIVDPRPYAVRSIAETYRKYPGIGILLPAMGYGDEQVRDLEETINRVPCDVVIIGTPIDLRKITKIRQPSVRVTYDLKEITKPDLPEILAKLFNK